MPGTVHLSVGGTHNVAAQAQESIKKILRQNSPLGSEGISFFTSNDHSKRLEDYLMRLDTDGEY